MVENYILYIIEKFGLTYFYWNCSIKVKLGDIFYRMTAQSVGEKVR